MLGITSHKQPKKLQATASQYFPYFASIFSLWKFLPELLLVEDAWPLAVQDCPLPLNFCAHKLFKIFNVPQLTFWWVDSGISRVISGRIICYKGSQGQKLGFGERGGKLIRGKSLHLAAKRRSHPEHGNEQPGLEWQNPECRHRAEETGFREGGHRVRCCTGLQENPA